MDSAAAPIDFRTDPSRYKHWKLAFENGVAYLTMDVNEDGGLKPGYKLKLNSYDLGVDIELADAVQRLRFEHPEVGAVVIRSQRDRIFCSGANINMGRERPASVAVGEQHQELLATDAESGVVAAQLGAQDLGHVHQHAVSAGVSVCVVDALEVVEVEGEDASRGGSHCDLGDELGERTAVAETRERVRERGARRVGQGRE